MQNRKSESSSWHIDKDYLLIGGAALLALSVVGLAGVAIAGIISHPIYLLQGVGEIAAEIAAAGILFGVGAGGKKLVSWFKKPRTEEQPLPSVTAEASASNPAFQARLRKDFNGAERSPGVDPQEPANALPGKKPDSPKI